MDRQRGIALVVSLVLLIMVMLLGVSAAQLSLQGEKRRAASAIGMWRFLRRRMP
jgi:type IV pilus assembly protein PilX